MSELKVQSIKSWFEVVQHKTKLLHRQIASLQNWVTKSGGGDALLESLCAPYYELLKEIYENDFPLANALEKSDLLLRLEGTAITPENPRLSIIAKEFAVVRDELAKLTKAILGIATPKGTLASELDLGLAAVAKGSLILGFTLNPPLLEAEGKSINLLGTEDPIYKAAKEAVRTLGVVAKFIVEGEHEQELSEIIIDAKVRDIAIGAVKELVSVNKNGVDSVSIGGKEMGYANLMEISSEGKRKIHSLLRNPVKSKTTGNFVGIVREIDLDKRRFELRQFSENKTEMLDSTRCAYGKNHDQSAVNWLNRKMNVFGKTEERNGKATLIEVETVEILSDEN